MIMCKEVSRLIASDAVDQLGPMRRLGVRLHLLICAHCRRFLSQLKKIGSAYRQIVEQKSALADEAESEQHLVRQLVKAREESAGEEQP